MTQANVKTTHSYIQKSDIIVWCLNANFLGDTGVVTEMQNVYGYGKPMICVITHIDEIDTPNRALEYVKSKEFVAYFKDIFLLSARDALKYSLLRNSSELQKTGLNNIKNYLNEKFRTKEDVNKEKENSILSSLDSLVKKDIKYHNLVLFDLAALKENISIVSKDLEYHEDAINKKITDWIIDKIKDTYLEPEFNEIKKLIDSAAELTEKEIQEVERIFSKE